MDIKQQCITEYLTQGTGYRQLAKKYGISRTTINKWVMIHQGIHNLPSTKKHLKCKRIFLSLLECSINWEHNLPTSLQLFVGKATLIKVENRQKRNKMYRIS